MLRWKSPYARSSLARRATLALLTLAAILMLAGCRRESGSAGGLLTVQDGAPEVTLLLAAEPPAPVVGPAQLNVTLLDAGGAPLEGADPVNLRGDMGHAGMTPVLAAAVARGGGVYTADFEWTMAGDWVVTVEATLPDGRVKAAAFPLTIEAD